MTYYDNIDVSEGIDVNKTIASKECDVCHYSFTFQPNVCFTNRCDDLLMMSINLSNIAILKTKDSDYWCFISLISKTEAIKLLQNADLTEKSWTLKHMKNR